MEVETALKLEPGTRVLVTIPGDAILAPHQGAGVFVEQRGGRLQIQLEGWVPAYGVRDIETGAHGPGLLRAPLVALEPQHVELMPDPNPCGLIEGRSSAAGRQRDA